MTNRIATVRKHKRRDRLEDNRFLMDFAEKAGRLALKRHQERGETVFYEQNGRLLRHEPGHQPEVVGVLEKPNFDLREYLCRG